MKTGVSNLLGAGGSDSLVWERLLPPPVPAGSTAVRVFAVGTHTNRLSVHLHAAGSVGQHKKPSTQIGHKKHKWSHSVHCSA